MSRKGVTTVSLDEAWLRRRYVDDGASTGQIAAEAGCGRETVRRRLIGLGIDRRQPGDWGVDGGALVGLVAAHGYRGAARALGMTIGNIVPLAESLGVREEASTAARQRRAAASPLPMGGTPRAIEAAQRALAQGAQGVHLEALHARVSHPEATLAELAVILGWKPNTYNARLRRALEAARDDALGEQR